MRFLKFAALFTLASIPLILLKKKADRPMEELCADGGGARSHSFLAAPPLESEEIFEYDLRTE